MQMIQLSISGIGSRDANMAVVQSTQRRSNEISAMASRMGIANRCLRRIQGSATVQCDGQLMFELRKIGHQMRASAAHIFGKGEGHWSQAYAKTIHFDCVSMLYHAILWHLCNAPVYCAGKYCQYGHTIYCLVKL